MTAKQIRQTLVEQLGNKEDAKRLYKQIQRMLGYKPLNSIYHLRITLNEWKEKDDVWQQEEYKLIHFEMNNGFYETAL